MDKQQLKQEQNWNRQLVAHQDRFAAVRQWSGLADWLVKLKQILTDQRGNILQRQPLFRKLASCLNPSLPIALHQLTIECYEIIVKNDLSVDTIFLICVGLFPFFSSATIRAKTKILELMNKHILKAGFELCPMATGLMVAILPGLLEMNEQLHRQITLTIDQLCECLGHEIVLPSIWTAMLRSSHCRIPGFKYLTAKMTQLGLYYEDPDDQEDDEFWDVTKVQKEQVSAQQFVEQLSKKSLEGDEQEDPEAVRILCSFLPFRQTLVLNTLICCLKDNNSLVVKACLDFLYKFLSLRTKHLTIPEQKLLIYQILELLVRRDISTTRKINLWLFGRPDQDNKYPITEKNQEVIPIIVSCFQEHLDTKDQQHQHTVLKMLLNFYSQHEHLIEKTLPELSIPLLRLVYRVNNRKDAAQSVKTALRIFDHVAGQKIVVLQSLGNYLKKTCQNSEMDEAINTLTLTDFFLEKLLKAQEINEKKELLVETAILLAGLLQIKHSNREGFLKAVLHLSQKIFSRYDQIQQKGQGEPAPDLETAIQLFSKFYQQLCQIVQNHDNYEEIFDLMTKLIIKVHRLRRDGTQAENWCRSMTETIMVGNLHYYLTTIEGITKIIEMSLTQPKYGLLRDYIVSDSKTRRTGSYILLAFQKLWGLLSFNHLHQRTIQLILKLSKQFPNLLTEVVSSSFRGSHQQKQISIVKFSVFWKLAGRFKELLSSKEFNEVNKIGLFIMLDFLEHENPLVRHTTKLWISDSLPQFSRIYDPLLEVLLQPAQLWYRTPQGQLIYSRKFEQRRIVDIMKKIKVLVGQAKEKLIVFLLKPLSQAIRPYVEHFVGTGKRQEISYLQLTFQLLMRYLQGRQVPSHQEQCHVDLIACQLFQAILMGIDQPMVCFNVMKPHILQIHKCLHFSIVNGELVSQIQILNLLKTLLFSSAMSRGSNQQLKAFLKDFISGEQLTRSLLLGLDNESPYIKQRYVEFLGLCHPLYYEYHQAAGQHFCQLLLHYGRKIKMIGGKRGQQDDEYRDLTISRRNTQILILLGGIKDIWAYFLDLRMKPFEKQKAQNETDSGYFSLSSWKSFVALGLQNSTDRPRRLDDISKQLLADLYQTITILIDCWNLSQLQPLYGLTELGIEPLTSEKFLAFNKALYSVLSQYEAADSVQSYIINIIRVVYNNYPSEIMNSLALYWISSTVLETRLKILEILIIMGLPVEQFFNTLADTSIFDKIKKIEKRKKDNKLNVERSFQCDILLFCHTFSQYSYQSFNMTQLSHMTVIWHAFIKCAKIFTNSRNVFTVLMLVEFLEMFVKKNNPKQVLWDDKIKKQVQLLATELTTLINVANGKMKIQPFGNFKNCFSEIFPLPTSVLLCYTEYRERATEVTPLFYFTFNECTVQKLNEIIRLYSFMVLRRVSYDLHQNLFNESDLILIRKVRESLSLLFPTIEDKSPGNSIFAQKASEIVCHFFEQKSIYPKQFRNDILQIFNRDDFFICTRRSFQHWLRIMNLVIDNNKDIDIFTEYLAKVSLASSIFTTVSSETKKKIKSFERICFILYAGERDRYGKRLDILVEKIAQVIRNAEAPQPVLILILFCIRIMIMRTSSEVLTQLFVNLWPMILFLLMSIFGRDFDGRTGSTNLVWAALKLIEMISLTEMAEFNTQQWVFFYDFAGIKLESKEVSQAQTKSPGKSMISVASSAPVPNSLLNYSFRPLIQKYLPSYVRPNFCQTISALEGRHKRNIIIKQDKIDDVELLKAKALALSQYMIINNSQKETVNMKEVEQLMESDFLTLDQFIYKVQ